MLKRRNGFNFGDANKNEFEREENEILGAGEATET